MSRPQWHCRRLGRGADLVLLHGWGLQGTVWETVAAALAERFRLHIYDLPGHGHSPALAPMTPLTPIKLDALCQDLMDQAPTSAHWLGWSLGGLVALRCASLYPARLSKLVLLASSPCFVAQADVRPGLSTPGSSSPGSSWPGMSAQVLGDFARDLSQNYRGTLLRFLSLVAQGAPDTSVLRQLRQCLDAAPLPQVASLQAGLQWLEETDLRASAAELTLPVLCLAGQRDALVPIEALQQWVNCYPQLQLRTVAQAGHAPFLSHPNEFVAALTEFLHA